MGCTLGNEGDAVDALLLNGCTAGWEAEVAFITTPTDVEQAHLLVKRCWIGKGTAKDGLHVLIVDTEEAAEKSHPSELIHVVIVEHSCCGLPSSTGEASHGAIVTVRNGAESLVDKWYQVVHVDVGYGLSRDVTDVRGVAHVAAHHYHDHLLCLACSNHVVKDEIYMALIYPAFLILSATMQ